MNKKTTWGGKRKGAGRKTTKPDRKTFNIRIDVTALAKVEKIAAAEGISKSDVINNLILGAK